MFKKNIIIKTIFAATIVVVSLVYALTSGYSGDKTIVKDDMWGIELKADGYSEWSDHPLRDEPDFIFAGKSHSQSCDILFSMFAKPAPSSATPQVCRKVFLKDPKLREERSLAELKLKSEVVVIESKDTPLTYTVFDQRFDGPKPFVDNVLYGYWARNDHCLELHISSVDCKNFKALAMPILESVRITPDNGATPETVALARKANKTDVTPGSWQIHILVGDQYLYDNPPVASRARYFYESALKRAGSNIDERGKWHIHEGIGLSWLADDEGAKALPYLIKALDAADKAKMETGARAEFIYNMACAYALMGETKKACKSLNDSLSIQDAAGKEKTIKQMRDDSNLASIQNSECYQSLLKEFNEK